MFRRFCASVHLGAWGSNTVKRGITAGRSDITSLRRALELTVDDNARVLKIRDAAVVEAVKNLFWDNRQPTVATAPTPHTAIATTPGPATDPTTDPATDPAVAASPCTWDDLLERKDWPGGLIARIYSQNSICYKIMLKVRRFVMVIRRSSLKQITINGETCNMDMKEIDEVLLGLLDSRKVFLPAVGQTRPDSISIVLLSDFVDGSQEVTGAPVKGIVNVVYGSSGAGKTMYAYHKFSREWNLGSKDHVLYLTFASGDTGSCFNMEKIKQEPNATKHDRLALMVARSVLLAPRELHCFTPVCDDIFARRHKATRSRDEAVYTGVIELIKSYFRQKDPTWTDNGDRPVEKFGTVVLVLDEIGKCLSVARGIVVCQESLRNDSWVKQHIESLQIVLCGTGVESLEVATPFAVATDPRQIAAIHIGQTTGTYLNQLRKDGICKGSEVVKTLENSELVRAACTNSRLAALLIKSIDDLGKEMNVAEEAEHSYLIKYVKHRLDTLTARSIPSLLLGVAILRYIAKNGIGRLSPAEMRCIDAALVYVLLQAAQKAAQKCDTLLPLYELKDSENLLDMAARIGVLVRGQEQEMEPGVALVVCNTLGEPRAHLIGAELEAFTQDWLLRLFVAQSGIPGVPYVMTKQLPCNNRQYALDFAALRDLFDTLRSNKCVAILNGENAPGADVIGVQRRPRYDEVEGHLEREAYDELWPPGVIARVTLVSCKRTRQEVDGQLEKLGVTKTRYQVGPLVIAVLAGLAEDNPPKQTVDEVLRAVADALQADNVDTITGVLRRGLGTRTVILSPCLVYSKLPRPARPPVQPQPQPVTVAKRPQTLAEYIAYLEARAQGWAKQLTVPPSHVHNDPTFDWVHGSCVNSKGLIRYRVCPPESFGPLQQFVEPLY